MNPFEDERLPVAESNHIPLLASPGLEVVSWELNFFAAEKFFDVARKPVQVQGFERFKVVGAVFIERSLVAVNEIIIEFERIGRNAAREQLTRLSDVAKGGEILISARVRAELPDSIATEPVGELVLKGFAEPLLAYRVLSARPT